MKKVIMINLNEVDAVKKFVNIITKIDGDFDLVRGRYTIDAKSIMGIFSLDLSEPVGLSVDEDMLETVRNAVAEFVV